MEDRLISRHQKSQMPDLIFLEEDAIVVLCEFVTKPHIVMSTSKFISGAAEHSYRHIREGPKTDLRWSFLSVLLHIGGCVAEIVLLEAAGK